MKHNQNGERERDEREPSPGRVINENSGVSVMLVAAAISAVASGTWFVSSRLNDMREAQTATQAMIQSLNRDCMGREAFRDWRDQLQQRNTSMVVPLVSEAGAGR